MLERCFPTEVKAYGRLSPNATETMPGKRRLTAGNIRTYVEAHPGATDKDIARHFGVPAGRVRSICVHGEIDLNSENPSTAIVPVGTRAIPVLLPGPRSVEQL